MLRQKLEDISVIYKAFKEYIKDRYITTEEILDVLCKHLPESRLIDRYRVKYHQGAFEQQARIDVRKSGGKDEQR